jgi:hypothetical protein
MATISGMAHIKTIFSLSPGTGKRFSGNASYSSDDSVTQLIHILQSFTTSNAFYKPAEEKLQRRQIWERCGQRMVTHFLSSIQEVPCPERNEQDRTSLVPPHRTRKLFSQGHDTKQCSFHSGSFRRLSQSITGAICFWLTWLNLGLAWVLELTLCQSQNTTHFLSHGKHFSN